VRKARKPDLSPLSIKLPSKRIRDKFLIIYELKGCQKASDFLTEYYGVGRMRIILNDRKFGRGKSKKWLAYYSENEAYFKRKGLNRRIVLHELFHHLIDEKGIDLPLGTEEKQANNYAKSFNKLN